MIGTLNGAPSQRHPAAASILSINSFRYLEKMIWDRPGDNGGQVTGPDRFISVETKVKSLLNNYYWNSNVLSYIG